MKRYSSIFIIIVFFWGNSFAQLHTYDSPTPTYLVQNVLLGGGVTASGISYVGASSARGSFGGYGGVGVTGIGLDSGVILSTGNIANAIGPNNAAATSTDNALSGDPDLDLLMSPAVTADAAVLEFDFVAQSDSIRFTYVFASDEYMEYVSTGSLVNDGFGFFISGPGITGPYSGGAKNIAIIPGTSLPVTMQNLNKISPYSMFYVDNGDGIPGIATGTVADGALIQYDGFTIPLTAKCDSLQCGRTYHIKIAIADGGAVLDRTVDSGVFLKAGSFSSPSPLLLSATTSLNGQVVINNDTSVYEGCGSARILFDRSGSTNLAVAETFHYHISGTGTNGVDYTAIAGDSIYFPAGEDSVYLNLNVLPDVLVEGTETFKIDCYFTTFCGTADTVSLALNILDSPPLSVRLNGDTILACPFSNLTLAAIASGGTAPSGHYKYVWTASTSVGDTIHVTPTTTTTYYVIVSDTCGNIAMDSTTITVIPYTPMRLTTMPDTVICKGEELTLPGIVTNGAPDYTYSWSPVVSGSSSITVHPESTTSYTLQVTDACRLTVSDTIVVNVYSVTADFVYNFQTNQVVQMINQSTGGSEFSWNFGDHSTDSTSTENNPADHYYQNEGTYTITLIVTNTQGCADTARQPIIVSPDFYFFYPNAFSPAGVLENHVYKGKGTGIKKYKMRIYDRWGNELFETEDQNIGWDGTIGGVKCPSAVYVVVFDLEAGNNEKRRYIGSLTLVE